MQLRFGFLALGLLVAAGTVQCHTWHTGRSCPFILPVKNLTIEKILGPWYVAYKLDESSDCIVWDLQESNTNPQQLVLTETKPYYLANYLVKNKATKKANIDIGDPEEVARMRIRWPTAVTGKADFVIFDTDYKNYIAISQCDKVGFFHRNDITLLSKTPHVDDLILKRMYSLAYPVEQNLMRKISHDNCEEGGGRKSKKEEKRNQELQKAALGKFVEDYDISLIESMSDGVEALGGSFSRVLR